MAHQLDIDQIVREVLARLRDGEAAEKLAADSTGKAEKTDKQLATATTAGSLELTDRLVTLATLENRLDGIRHVILRRGAVVTPAARDALGARRINTSYAPTAAKAATTLVVGVASLAARSPAFDRAAFLEELARDGRQIERIAETGLASVVAELASLAALGGRPAVLLTAEPEAAACLANRRSGVRAVAGRDVATLRRAIVATGANLLTIDPTGAPAAIGRLLREFCDGWPPRVPAILSTDKPQQ